MGVRIDAYRNLNDDCISIKSREAKNRGLVIDHVDCAYVKNAEFIVQPSGRERVLEEGKKNVHAFVRGVLCESINTRDETSVAVTYNPKKYSNFVTRDGKRAVVSAEIATVTTDGVKAYGLEMK